ncbi:uncharacterized protein VNE69_06063 [Vairimorpha necatrix]|uniref:Uncharacterized protein n=1 Tax=Vairimorpha necatrix TaxID=6039 RepID=A0AAX4JCQ5_9MICR
MNPIQENIKESVNIKEEIISVLNNKPPSKYIFFFQYDKYKLNDLDSRDLLDFSIPFLNGKYLETQNRKQESIEEYENYMFYIEDLKDQEKYNIKSRNDKIKMYKIKKSFRFDFIDWDDKEWILSLLEYLYVVSIETVNYLKLEIIFQEMRQKEEQEDFHRKINNSKKTLTYKNIERIDKIDETHNSTGDKTHNYKNIERNIINRKDMLKNRIQPKYTLDQFAEKLLKNINERPEIEKKEEEREKDLEELRRQDEINDERHNTRGNTENIG